MGKSTYNGTSPYEYVDFLERRNAELEAEVERLRRQRDELRSVVLQIVDRIVPLLRMSLAAINAREGE